MIDSVGESEDEKLKKFKKRQQSDRKFESASKANAVMRSSGYDHLEGPDFEGAHRAISDEYEHKAGETCFQYTVHGIVQGLGYRNFVRNVALRCGIKGYVKNVSDGSVEILAVGNAKTLAVFEREIQVSEKYGIQVMHLYKKPVDEAERREFDGFTIERDKKL